MPLIMLFIMQQGIRPTTPFRRHTTILQTHPAPGTPTIWSTVRCAWSWPSWAHRHR